MKATLLSSTLVAIGLFAANAYGQGYTPPAPISSPPFAYHHASTLEEGFARGVADGMRAVGEMNYNNSLAMINGQEAYSRYLDNRLKAVATYFDMRKLNREARAEERGQRATVEDLARIAKMRAPDRLAAYHFDAARNRLIWPELFQEPYFAAERERIDRLMGARAGRESREIQRLAGAMTDKLTAIVHSVQPGEYAAAKRFVTSLQYEMNFAPGAAGVASR
jgi:hypothetical protein